jgi:hypothetical protein
MAAHVSYAFTITALYLPPARERNYIDIRRLEVA